LDYLTWQSRMVQLFPQVLGHAVFVHEMRITQGLELGKNVLDPMKHYRVVIEKKKEILKPLRFSEACSLWRNSTSLFHLRDETHRPLRNFQWLVASRGRARRGSGNGRRCSQTTMGCGANLGAVLPRAESRRRRSTQSTSKRCRCFDRAVVHRAALLGTARTLVLATGRIPAQRQ
jgi:hypothetical protein